MGFGELIETKDEKLNNNIFHKYRNDPRFKLIVGVCIIFIIFLTIHEYKQYRIKNELKTSFEAEFKTDKYFKEIILDNGNNWLCPTIVLDDSFDKLDIPAQQEILDDMKEKYDRSRIDVLVKHDIKIKDSYNYDYTRLLAKTGKGVYSLTILGAFTEPDGTKHEYTEFEDASDDSYTTQDTEYIPSMGSSSVYASDSDKISAWTCAEKLVKDNLKAPSTADFPWYSEEYITPMGNNRFMVNSYVDAENGFGAKIRSNFSVEIILTGSGFTYENLMIE